jgi:hypothetical protein
MFIEKLMRQAESCAPPGREMAGTGDHLRYSRRLISCAPPAHLVGAFFNQTPSGGTTKPFTENIF